MIDEIYISDEYENFPGDIDQRYLLKEKFHKVFNPMAKHKENDWFLKRHQTAEIFDMFDFKYDPAGYQINLPFKVKNINRGWVTFAPFAGFYNSNNNKMLSFEKAQEITNGLIDLGCKVLQIGGWDEPKLEKTFKKNLTYYKSLRAIAESELFLHCDTGLGWAASGIKHKCLGLYSNEGYGEFIRNIQPINPNAQYLDARVANEIPNQQIFENIDRMLK